MDNIIIKQAGRDDFGPIAKLIAAQNKNPETHCIQSDTGAEPQSVENEMLRLASESAICFVTAIQNDVLAGAMGCEFDEELGRGWARGPFIVAGTGDWEATANALLEGLQKILPSTIHWLDSFLNIANQQGNNFYLSHGFKQLRLVHVYTSNTFAGKFERSSSCAPLTPLRAQDFIALHDSIFPQTYASGQKIFEKIDGDHQVFIYSQDDEILGYLYAAIDEDSHEGSVEFVGVREDARGKGVGRILLQTALTWLFQEKQVNQAILVVNDNLTNARSLYERVGFQLKYTGVHTRKEW